MTSQHITRPDSRLDNHGLTQEASDLDIPFGSLDAAAMAELPYTFRQTGTCTRYYNEFFG
ncbi:hypothetical protein [Cupriavidus sp. IDO]|uniref:hypothetical protein n=1 Tax=Cupriavidus sp. IDO TaxID=1539142 RepID=UPI00057941F5|nr:hypothetical protein [Cupriavidus sp. IDO]KWR89101.1 hypothetical protein RM96_16245 [Cupriavidus sp. IDO]